jgi:hypothetical protein
MSDSIKSSSNATNTFDGFSGGLEQDNASPQDYASFLNSPLGGGFNLGGMFNGFNASSATQGAPLGSLNGLVGVGTVGGLGSNGAQRNVAITSPGGSVGGLTFEPADSFASSLGTLKLNGKTIGSFNGTSGVAIINRGNSAVANILSGGHPNDGKPLAIKGAIMQSDNDPGVEPGLMDNVGNFVRNPVTTLEDKIIGNQGTSTRLSD